MVALNTLYLVGMHISPNVTAVFYLISLNLHVLISTVLLIALL